MASKPRTHGIPHEDRTAAEPRDEALYPVILHEIRDVNNDIKLFRLRIKDRERGVKVCTPKLFSPSFHCKWIDVASQGMIRQTPSG
jgi:hypothetical protein